jgi:hypothetical protein
MTIQCMVTIAFVEGSEAVSDTEAREQFESYLQDFMLADPETGDEFRQASLKLGVSL